MIVFFQWHLICKIQSLNDIFDNKQSIIELYIMYLTICQQYWVCYTTLNKVLARNFVNKCHVISICFVLLIMIKQEKCSKLI